MTLHALKRAKERYKLDLTFDDLREILDRILEGEAKKRFRYKDCTVYSLRYKKKLIIPVVSDHFKIVTFYEQNGKKETFRNIDGEFRIKRLKGAI